MKQHHHDVHTLSAAYALDAVAPLERRAFDEHLRACAECKHEVAEFQATAARLAAAASQAPRPAMKQWTMSAIDGVRQLPPRLTGGTSREGRDGGLRHRGLSFALAASVAGVVALSGLALWQQQENEDLRQRARQTAQHLGDISTVLTAPDARTTYGKTSNGALTSATSSNRQKKTVFTAAGLPVPAPGKTYQLWLSHDGTMRPAGFLHDDGTVLIEGETTGAKAVGLTVEPAGGSPRPTTTPLLLMTLPA
ncbi:anti-sigma factor domain-containing protein [Streptomyces sp. NPDC012825]|uniref:anti-sigma factor n=1 Tax=Streptomyces sp. NPDC012825 TaxID=3364851 RepID=UPI0036AE2487